MLRLFILIIGNMLLFIACTAPAYASPYRATMKGDTKELRIVAAEVQDGRVRRSSPTIPGFKSLRFSTVLPSIGRFAIFLNRVTFKSWDASLERAGLSARDDKDIALVEGYARAHGKRLAVGGSIYREKKNGRPVLHLIMNAVRSSRRALYIKAYLEGDELRDMKVSSIPSVALRQLACGNTSGEQTEPEIQAVTTSVVSPSNRQIATIATEFDPEWYTTYGENSNAQIATLVAGASAIYRNQLGLRMVISRQHGFSTTAGNPFIATDSGALLSSFRTYEIATNILGDADLYHLFSGKDFDGGVIGLAWVGVTCSAQEYSFGITQKFNPAADVSILTHELGHNLGAVHDMTDTQSLMAPYVHIPGSSYFSAASLAQIVNHLGTSPFCFDIDEGSIPDFPTPSPTRTIPPPGVPSGPTPMISLGASVTREGVLSMRIGLSKLQSGCEIFLFGSPRKSGTRARVCRFVPNTSITTLRFAGLKDPTPKNSYLSFSANYVCPVITAKSSVVNVLLDVISKKTNRSTVEILSAIKSALRSLRKLRS